MKALLKTRCGCSRMVDIPDRMPTVRIPLIEEMSVRYGNNYDITKFLPIRDFYLEKQEMIAGIDVVVYIEKRQEAPQGQNGTAGKPQVGEESNVVG